MSGFWYLATPYSAHPLGPNAAYRQACEQAALLIKAGVSVFSPIAHSHQIAKVGGIDPFSHEVWLPIDEPMMDAAIGMIQCRLPGWNTSRGMDYEIDRFAGAGKPIVVMEPGEVPALLLPAVA